MFWNRFKAPPVILLHNIDQFVGPGKTHYFVAHQRLPMDTVPSALDNFVEVHLVHFGP